MKTVLEVCDEIRQTSYEVQPEGRDQRTEVG